MFGKKKCTRLLTRVRPKMRRQLKRAFEAETSILLPKVEPSVFLIFSGFPGFER